MKPVIRQAILAAALASVASSASALSYFGSLSNFDVLNDTGSEKEGFEIEIHGVSSSDISYTFGGSYNRYGTPRIAAFAGGVYVRYESAYDDVLQKFLTSTPMAANLTPSGHDCYQGGPIGNYLSSGCEHFGVGLTKNATDVKYRWLDADPANPGQLIGSGANIPIAAPVWQVQEPQQAGAPVVVIAQIEAPEIENNQKFGEAVWAKVVKSKTENPVLLEDLLSDDEMFDELEVETEFEWKILQAREGRPEDGVLEIQNPVNANGKSISYRYEFYRYTGGVTDEGEVECLIDGCNEPGAGELGAYIGAQMAALNLAAPVPEPETYALFGVGGLLIASRLRSGRPGRGRVRA
jgi:hypothetical protein